MSITALDSSKSITIGYSLLKDKERRSNSNWLKPILFSV